LIFPPFVPFPWTELLEVWTDELACDEVVGEADVVVADVLGDRLATGGFPPLLMNRKNTSRPIPSTAMKAISPASAGVIRRGGRTGGCPPGPGWKLGG
jgi:hypothetical protein